MKYEERFDSGRYIRIFCFRGAEQIGWEDYGNGGTDPFEQDGRELIESG